MFLRLARTVLRIPAPRITREHALSIARTEWERDGFIARKPRVEERLKEYVVWMESEIRGGNLGYHADTQTGAIVRVTTLPR